MDAARRAGTVRHVDAPAIDFALAPAVTITQACELAAKALAERGGRQGGVYFERSGRLRCQASAGGGHLQDGIPVSSGSHGLALRTGDEQIVRDADRHAQLVCLPLTVWDDVVGVLVLAAPEGHLGDTEVDRARALGLALSRRITELGGPPNERPGSRLAQHTAALAGLDDPGRIERTTLFAALDLAGMQSGVVLGRDGTGRFITRCSAGPLAGQLAALSGSAIDAIAEVVAGGASVALRERDLGEHLLPIPAALAPLAALGAQRAVVVPLVARGVALGALVLVDARDVLVGTDEIELLELLGSQAANSLRSAAALAELRVRATTDPLTGLGHRGMFHETLAASHRRPINTAVALCDIDLFKQVNDLRGHQEGDRALLAVAAALQSALRRGDSLYRLGGDEFAALLAVQSDDEALAAVERMRAAVLAANAGVTVSIGVAVPSVEETDSVLIGRADQALYAAKGAGRDGVAIAPPPPEPSAG